MSVAPSAERVAETQGGQGMPVLDDERLRRPPLRTLAPDEREGAPGSTNARATVAYQETVAAIEDSGHEVVPRRVQRPAGVADHRPVTRSVPFGVPDIFATLLPAHIFRRAETEEVELTAIGREARHRLDVDRVYAAAQTLAPAGIGSITGFRDRIRGRSIDRTANRQRRLRRVETRRTSGAATPEE